MKFLVVGVCILFVLMFSGCGQKKEEKKVEAKAWSSPVSSMDKRNDRFDAGKLVYDRNCKVCHQANRMGVPKIYPPLKNTKRVGGNKDYLIDVLLNGSNEEIIVEGVKYKGVMASYRGLSDREIAGVINYIRSDSEAASEVVSEDDVRKRR
ncbi:c-type cytochrome [Saccharicrinis fermentans]|uniref:Cytochrome c552 n=1 Tax=Saccharicrinis fermentans DSM 9555 = JCM 21142 TaxID=869213 RepID=W7YHC4_9BACT|nr:cytochrome c [Saccharicrinis fermentans]GAF03836.1 cytochrome c552 [Saccharicrinis fermentans DSM 9555 = JCM 21142]